jgi:hypothetical protein
MNTWARKSFKVGVLSAGALLFAGTAANAATLNSIGNSGFLTGNQANTITQAPVDVCGNSAGVLGFGAAGCKGGSWATIGDDNTTLNSFGNTGFLTGNQLNTVVQAPVDVCGNAVGAGGAAFAGCEGGSSATFGSDVDGNSNAGISNAVKPKHVKANKISKASKAGKASTAGSHMTESTTLTSVGNFGAGVGNQSSSVVQIPIDVCGNAVSVFGAAVAHCKGGASATDSDGGSTNLFSGFNAGFLTGNQSNSVVQIPINVCGNAVGVLGGAVAGCEGGSSATIGNPGTPGNPGNPGYDYGVGASNTGTKESTKAASPADYTPSTSGDACSPTLTSVGNAGFLTGNQLNSVIQAPVEVSGNAVGILGFAQASSRGGASASC